MSLNLDLNYCRECHSTIHEKHTIQGLHDSCAVVFYERIALEYEQADMKGGKHD